MNIPLKFIIVGLYGLFIGTIVNTLADEIPKRRGLIRFQENSLFIEETYQRVRKIIILFAYTFLAIDVWTVSNNILNNILTLIVFAFLGLVFIIDYEFGVILNFLIVIGIVLGLVFGIYQNGLLKTVLGGAIGLIVLLVLFYFGKFLMPLFAHLRNIKLEKQAIYRNDVMLGLILGFYFGWSSVVTGLLVALAFMGFAGVIVILCKVALGEYDPNLSIPLGPFMALSAIIIYFFG